MIDRQDTYFLQAEHEWYSLAVCSDIGDRKEQQDRAGYILTDGGGVIVVCDGMGGHRGGQRASLLATESLLRAYKKRDTAQDVREFLLKTVLTIDKQVVDLTDPDGSPTKGGTTLSAVLLENRNLHWVSVGDSRVYVYRRPEFVQITNDHTYLALQQSGQLPSNLPPVKHPESVLVSFLGVDQPPKIERNREPLVLQAGDTVLLTTDGLYKLLSDGEITLILQQHPLPADAVKMLVATALSKAETAGLKADNITVAALRVK